MPAGISYVITRGRGRPGTGPVEQEQPSGPIIPARPHTNPKEADVHVQDWVAQQNFRAEQVNHFVAARDSNNRVVAVENLKAQSCQVFDAAYKPFYRAAKWNARNDARVMFD